MAAMQAFSKAPPASRPAAGVMSDRAAMLRAKLVPPMPPASLWGWAGPLLVTLFGGFLRFYRLSDPRAVVFDETYYVPDAYGILKHGVEINHSSNINTLLVHGNTHIFIAGG